MLGSQKLFLQDHHPGKIASYKANHVDKMGLPDDVALVLFGGRPTVEEECKRQPSGRRLDSSLD